MSLQDHDSHFPGESAASKLLDPQVIAPRYRSPVMQDRFFSNTLLEAVLICISVILGVVHFWMGRYAMNVDGMSYMDVGDAFIHHNWAVAINGWWSPLYPWLVGSVLGIARPSLTGEIPLVQFVNLIVFVLTLFAFRFLLHCCDP